MIHAVLVGIPPWVHHIALVTRERSAGILDREATAKRFLDRSLAEA